MRYKLSQLAFKWRRHWPLLIVQEIDWIRDSAQHSAPSFIQWFLGEHFHVDAEAREDEGMMTKRGTRIQNELKLLTTFYAPFGSRMCAQQWTWGSPRKNQTMLGPSICQTSQMPSLPTSWFLKKAMCRLS